MSKTDIDAVYEFLIESFNVECDSRVYLFHDDGKWSYPSNRLTMQSSLPVKARRGGELE